MRAILMSVACMGCVMAAQAKAVRFHELGGGSYRLPVISLKQSRVAGAVLHQFDFSCGLAAVATLLNHHYGVPVTEQTVMQEMYAVGDQPKIQKEGFSLLDMMHYLAGLVFTADSFKQPLDKLIEARVAAVALVNEAGYHHFIVIEGLDATRVLVGEPAKGIRAMSRAQFDSIWIDCLLFVIHNRIGQARFNQRSEGEDWLAMSDGQLDEMRGGFSVQPGVMVSFGIMRTVQINGVLVSSSGFQITDLRSITAAQDERLGKQTAAVSLVHNGARQYLHDTIPNRHSGRGRPEHVERPDGPERDRD